MAHTISKTNRMVSTEFMPPLYPVAAASHTAVRKRPLTSANRPSGSNRVRGAPSPGVRPSPPNSSPRTPGRVRRPGNSSVAGAPGRARTTTGACGEPSRGDGARTRPGHCWRWWGHLWTMGRHDRLARRIVGIVAMRRRSALRIGGSPGTARFVATRTRSRAKGRADGVGGRVPASVVRKRHTAAPLPQEARTAARSR